MDSSLVERRKHHRFSAKEGAYVEFCKKRLFNLLKPQVVQSAHMVDISKGGMAFQYEGRQMWSTEFNELSIFGNTEDVKIDNIPFKIISDRLVRRNGQTKDCRRCGVRFDGLSDQHKFQLDHFIRNYATRDPQQSPTDYATPFC